MGNGSGLGQTAGRLRLSARHAVFNGAAGWLRKGPRSGLVQHLVDRKQEGGRKKNCHVVSNQVSTDGLVA